MLLVADISNKLIKKEREGSEVLFRDCILAALDSGLEKSTIKGGKNMKTREKIWLNRLESIILTGVLTLGMLAILCVPQTTHARSFSNHSNVHNAVSSLAERQNRADDQKSYNNDDLNIAANISAAADEKIPVRINEESDTEEKEMKGGNEKK